MSAALSSIYHRRTCADGRTDGWTDGSDGEKDVCVRVRAHTVLTVNCPKHELCPDIQLFVRVPFLPHIMYRE